MNRNSCSFSVLFFSHRSCRRRRLLKRRWAREPKPQGIEEMHLGSDLGVGFLEEATGVEHHRLVVHHPSLPKALPRRSRVEGGQSFLRTRTRTRTATGRGSQRIVPQPEEERSTALQPAWKEPERRVGDPKGDQRPRSILSGARRRSLRWPSSNALSWRA
jgi:hypothetical protein